MWVRKSMLFLTLLVSAVICAVKASDKCNFHATLIETETFYLTQQFSKNITIDLTSYIEAFPDWIR